MTRMFKYILPDRPGEYPVLMPYGSRVKAVANQREQIAMWAECPINSRQHEYVFAVSYTGDDTPSGAWSYLDVVLLHKGEHVCHVWQKVLP